MPPASFDASHPSPSWSGRGALVDALRYKFEVPDPHRDRWDRPLYYAGSAGAGAGGGGGSAVSAFDQAGMNDRGSRRAAAEGARPAAKGSTQGGSFVKRARKKKGAAAPPPVARREEEGEFLTSLTISEQPLPPPPPASSSSSSPAADPNAASIERSRLSASARVRLANLSQQIAAAVPFSLHPPPPPPPSAPEPVRLLLHLAAVLASALAGEGVRGNASTRVAREADPDYLHEADRVARRVGEELRGGEGFGHVEDWGGLREGFLRFVKVGGGGGKEQLGDMFR
ncbi:hypothetical protein TeGR_g75, partial [Tetraparma gracilis]